ncbi:hypothetical protein GCM10010422_01630 [Streptomyces graminearus]|uniref:Uncharacterized protein n=1 Tax=Streptomyces graminearus TaxID=284030 RepID=A0ABP5XSH9_9ACTN
MQGDQGGGAGGVDGDGGAFEAEGVGDPAGDDAGGAADEPVSLDAFGRAVRIGAVALVGHADEDTGAAAAQLSGGDTGAFEGLPGGLQEQALLGVHGQGLARGDPEEARVEVGGVVEESAVAGVGLAGAFGVGVVERVHVPAAVGRELRDGVAAGRHQVPQGLGRVDAAGQVAAHRDDGDGLVVGGGRLPVLRYGAPRAEEFALQEAGERGGAGVVEDQGGRQGETGGRVDLVAEFDGGQGVEAEVLEGPVGFDLADAAVAEDGRDMRADQVEQGPGALGLGQSGEPVREGPGAGPGVGGRRGGAGAAHLGHLGQQGAGAAEGERSDEPFPCDVGDDDRGVVAVQGALECGHGECGGQGDDAPAAQVFLVGVGDHAAVGPGAPGDRGGGQAPGPAPGGEPVEVGIGGGVGGLAAAAPHAGDRGEEHEGVQLAVAEQFVQVGGAVGLRREGAGEVGRCQFVEGGELGHARGVEDGGEPVFVEQGRDRVAVGDVAGGEGDAGAQVLQFGPERGRAGCVGALAAGEHQVLGARTGEPAGDVSAEGARAAGDQDGAARRPCPGGGAAGVVEPGGEHAGGADGDLVLPLPLVAGGTGALGEYGGDPPGGALVHGGGQVDQAAPAVGVLQCQGAAEAPHLVLYGAERGVVEAAGGGRATGGAPQRGVDVRVAQRLRQGHRLGEAPGERGVLGRGGLVGGEQRQDAVERSGFRRGPGQLTGQPGAVGARVDRQRDQSRAASGESRAHRLGPLVALRRGEQPGAVQEIAPGQAVQRLPGQLVAPAVHGGLLASSAPPGGQLGYDDVQFAGVQLQCRGEGFGVLALDARPEVGVDRVHCDGLGLGGLQPVALLLEGVGGQVDAAGAREEGPPVGGRAVGVQFGERGDDGSGFGAVGAEHGDGDDAVRAALGHAAEDTAGTDLREGGHTQLVQGPDTVGETDRLADMPYPVLRGVRLGQPPGEVRNDRDPRLVEGQPTDRLRELRQHRIHQRRMERVTDPQPGRLATLTGEQLGNGEDRVLGARNHHRAGAIDRRDTDLAGEMRQHLVLRRLHGDHRAALGERLHQRGTRRHQFRRVLKRQHTRHMRCGDLADRVTGHVVRPQAPRLQQPEQRHFEGEQRRLGVPGAVQLLRVRVERDIEAGADLVVGGGERGEGVVEFTAHAEPLRALTGEEEPGPVAEAAGVLYNGRGGNAGRQRPYALGEFFQALADDGRPAVPGGAGRGEGVADVGRGAAGAAVFQEGEQALGLGAQRRLALRREHPRPYTGGGGLGRFGGEFLVGGRGLLDDRVHIGAADAEGRDGGAAGVVGPGPVDGLGEQPYAARRPVDLVGRLGHVQRPRQDAVADGHHHLDDPGDTGGRLGVPDVGLDGSEPQRPVRRVLLAVGGEQRLRLDRVAEGGGRAVCLDRVDLGGGQARVLQRLPDHPFLGRAVRGGEAVGGAVLVDGAATDDGEHVMAEPAGVGQPLQQQDADALGHAGAVGGGGERAAAAVGRQAALGAERDEGVRGGHHGGTARKGERALAAAQRLGGQVERDQ